MEWTTGTVPGLEFQLLDTHCEFYENTYSYELWKLDLNDYDPTSYWWFEGFFCVDKFKYLFKIYFNN